MKKLLVSILLIIVYIGYTAEDKRQKILIDVNKKYEKIHSTIENANYDSKEFYFFEYYQL